MADISITSANVAASTANTTTVFQKTAGVTITAGQPVYLDAAVNQLKLAKATSATTAAVVGIALNSASSGQPCDYVTQDTDFTVGGTLTAGKVIMLSASTAGGLLTQTPADWDTAGVFNTIIGVATSATKAKIRCNPINQAGVAHA